MASLWQFRRDWIVAASPEDVYAVCADIDAYPTWWREIRSIRRIDADTGLATIRSVLPYGLHLRMTRELQDPVDRRLRTGLAGDLTGWAEFHIEAAAGGHSAVAYRQDVEVTAPVLGRVAPLFGPLLRANHGVMMRSCERGMAALLEQPLG
ncbi:SRPBCC family protein [Knoellia sp. CPCC 206453]|uniref:SRPBCC family protein n=1 Tax=Knoellia pratensis TaxID=3404796 RepID=UPI00361796E4